MMIEHVARGLKRKLGRIKRSLWPPPPGPVMVSAHTMAEKDFLSLFNIAGVQDHLANNDVPRARSALLAHYIHRTAPVWPRPPRTLTDLRLDLSQISTEALIEKADALVELNVSPDERMPQTDAEGNIDWGQNVTTTPEWLWRLNRTGWWPVLGLAYEYTHDERFTEAFEKQLLSWIKNCPPPIGIDEKSYCWRLMETALRMRVSWIPSFALFLNSDKFSHDAKLTMLRSIHDHAKFLSFFKTNMNHLLREIGGLVSVCTYFPEFTEAGKWQKIALRRLEGELKFQIHRDGSHLEVSTGYQLLVIDELEYIFDLVRLNSFSPLAKSLGTVLEKMYAVMAYVIRPDWTFPEINDGFLRWRYDRLAQAAEKFERDDFLYVGSGGRQGAAPVRCSLGFEDAGWYVMRSDWTPEARYLFFDAGPHGGHHGHEDKLSIEVYAFGQSFIVDSGSYTYEKEDPYRAYFVGSQGHNTVLVNGLGQIRRWMDEPAHAKRGSGKSATWISDANFDYVSSSYGGGYADFGFDAPKEDLIIKDVKHRRHVLFVKPDYWVLVDELEASHPYRYDLMFHTPPGMRVVPEINKQIVLSKSDDGPGLCIIPAEPDRVDVSWISGSKAPIQGWYSVDHLQKAASNVVIYRCNDQKKALIITLLFPYRSRREKEDVAIEALAVNGGDGKGFRVANSQGIDYLMVSQDGRPQKVGRHRSSGFISAIRADGEGNILSRSDIPCLR